MLTFKDLAKDISNFNKNGDLVKLLGVEPYFEFQSDEIGGYIYFAMIGGGKYTQFHIKVEGHNRFPDFKENSTIYVEFIDAKFTPYATKNGSGVSQRAKDVKEVKAKGAQ